jgi:antirestriction protein ArdC
MNVYEIITERILGKLEEGTVPWRKPWQGGEAGMPRNLQTGHPYRGINVFLLAAAGYASPYWLTFRQARQRGGSVRSGEHARRSCSGSGTIPRSRTRRIAGRAAAPRSCATTRFST